MSPKQPVSSLLTFRVGPFKLCVDAVEAEAIIEMPQIRSVPGMPPAVAGVFPHREKIAVAISLMHKFGVTEPNSKKKGQLLVARINGEPKGFWVDEVLDLQKNSALGWQKLPQLGHRTIFDHAVLSEKDIFFHTDFKKLFHAEDAGKAAAYLSAAAGTHLARLKIGNRLAPQISRSVGNIGSTDPDKETCIEESPLPREPVPINPDPVSSPVPNSSADAGNSSLESSAADRFQNRPTCRTDQPEGHRKGHPTGRPAPEAGIRLYSGPATDPADFGESGFKQNPAAYRDYYRSCRPQYTKPVSEGSRSKAVMIAAVLLVLFGTGTALLWLTYPGVATDANLDSVIADKRNTKQSTSFKKTITAVNYQTTGLQIATEQQYPGNYAKTLDQSPLPDSNPAQKPETESASTRHTAQPEDVEKTRSMEEFPGVGNPDSEADDRDDDIPASGGGSDLGALRSYATAASPRKSDKQMNQFAKDLLISSVPMSSATGVTPRAPSSNKMHSAKAAGRGAGSEADTESEPSQGVHSAPKAAEEILRIETDDFTLTVKRPDNPRKYRPSFGTAPETAVEGFIHIVVKGDTLWDIADNYLGNPFRYPELAELSRIKDPHWIYPGDIITIAKKKLNG